MNVSPRAFDKGFPGVTDRFEWFAIEYKTTFHALRSGEYTFRINSDDGTKLFIDGELVIENDGIHPPQSRDGKVELTGGAHEMVVQYFQGPRNRIALELFYTPAKGEEAIFPGTDFTLSTPGRSPTWWWWLVALGGILLIFLAGYSPPPPAQEASPKNHRNRAYGLLFQLVAEVAMAGALHQRLGALQLDPRIIAGTERARLGRTTGGGRFPPAPSPGTFQNSGSG